MLKKRINPDIIKINNGKGEKMYKIFIDTNIILDFYRINNQDSIIKILKEIKKYKKYFISTKQSQDEFLRNRDRTITDFAEELKKQNYKVHANNVIATLNSYAEYRDSIINANNNTRKIIEEMNNLIENPDIDLIYKIYLNLNEITYIRTDKIIENAQKRKIIGNPPTSKKETCGDEIIWETLLEYCDDDLIIVSRDATFKTNYSFLRDEFKKERNRDLKVVDSITKAIELNEEHPPKELELVESDMIVESNLQEYGQIQDDSNWANIVYNTLVSLNNEADLKDIYCEVKKIVKQKYPEKMKNKNMDATVRGILQRYSSDSDSFNGKNDLFTCIKKGRWGIRKK